MGSGFGMKAAQVPAAGSGTSPIVWILVGGGIFVVLGAIGLLLFFVVAVRSSPQKGAVANADEDAGSTVNLEGKDDDAGAAAGKPKPKATTTAPTATVAVTSPTSTTGGKQPFPRARANAEVDRVLQGVQSCHRTGDPTGTGSIRVDFEPDGRVGTLTRAPFGTTTTGSCISARMRAINIGQFSGSRESIEATFIIRDTSPPPTTTPTPTQPPPPTVTPPVPTKPPIFKGDAGR